MPLGAARDLPSQAFHAAWCGRVKYPLGQSRSPGGPHWFSNDVLGDRAKRALGLFPGRRALWRMLDACRHASPAVG